MRVLQLKNLTLLLFQQKYYLYYGSTYRLFKMKILQLL